MSKKPIFTTRRGKSAPLEERNQMLLNDLKTGVRLGRRYTKIGKRLLEKQKRKLINLTK